MADFSYQPEGNSLANFKFGERQLRTSPVQNQESLTILTRSGLTDLEGRVYELEKLAGSSVMTTQSDSIFSNGLLTRSGRLIVVEHLPKNPLVDTISIYVKGELVSRIASDLMVTNLFETQEGRVFVGTNGGMLGVLSDSNGIVWNRSFCTLPSRQLWHTPWGGPPDIHSMVQSINGTLYAAVHVGGIVSSIDGGESWKQLSSGFARIVRDGSGSLIIVDGPGLNPDVHDIACHPLEPETLLAATRDGFYVSENGGEDFEARNDGIDLNFPGAMNYQRSLAIFPDRDVWLVASASGPNRGLDSRLFRTENRGRSWAQVNGIPKDSDHIDTMRASFGGRAIALVGSSIFESFDYGCTWHQNNHFQWDFYRDPFHHVVRPVVAI